MRLTEEQYKAMAKEVKAHDNLLMLVGMKMNGRTICELVDI